MAAAMLAVTLALVTFVAVRNRDSGVSVVPSNADLTLPIVTVPEVPQPVDPGTLQDGWYLVLYPEVSTTEDALLLQAAREVALEARGVGYGDVKIVRDQGVQGECGEDGCFMGSPAVGYDVLLKGPYPVPNWSDSDADLDARFAWHQSTLAQERGNAASRGLTLIPSLHLFAFLDE